ncbi:GNAT family N-acetyltransferase [Roseateles oligotrophus]|uniref:GNAT family N-acetyltransferase n=1 Tax=Roseateles oligotrophus TaxID=1769250 RepID=A0ABT2YKW5_9BURK|nr:GNAT family protein [Roseateles oligotrophus]MCV2370704.1 GNAT family N-acetyltransferase [Roseateles oligotrophus]
MTPTQKRVRLRHVTEADLPLLCLRAAAMEQRGEFESTRMSSPKSIHKRFAEDDFSSDDSERLLVCAEGGEVIGDVSHFLAHRYATARELGWSIFDPALRGQGFGTAAAQALVNYLFNNFNINRVCCSVSPGNIASRRIAEKAGLRYEGCLRGVVFIRGEYVDSEVFGLLRADWQRG